MGDIRDAVSTAEDMAEDAVTDIKDAVDPDNNGKPQAESDGKVDGSTSENKADDTKKPGTTDKNATTGRDTTGTSRDTTSKGDATTGVLEGMELEEKGINPWAIVIAVIVVIAVLVLIFILIPKRRR